MTIIDSFPILSESRPCESLLAVLRSGDRKVMR